MAEAKEVDLVQAILADVVSKLQADLGWHTPTEVANVVANSTQPLIEEIDRLREHIRNIGAHVKPLYGNEKSPSDTGQYLINAQAVYRALGEVDEQAPSCPAEGVLAHLQTLIAALGPVLAALQAWREAVRDSNNPRYVMDVSKAAANLAKIVDSTGSLEDLIPR